MQKYFCSENLFPSLPGYESAFLGDLATSRFLRAQRWEAELFPSCLRHQGWSWHHPRPNLCISFSWSRIAGFCSAGCSHPVVNSLAFRKSTGTRAGVDTPSNQRWWQCLLTCLFLEQMVQINEDGTVKICGKKTG